MVNRASGWQRRQTGREKNADSLRLPAKLQEELAQHGGDGASFNRRREPSRKDRRKEERRLRKQGVVKPRRGDYSGRANDGPAAAAQRAVKAVPPPPQPSRSAAAAPNKAGSRGDARRPAKQRAPFQPRSAAAPPLEPLDAHDEHIAMLEKRLGVRGGGKANRDVRAEKRLRQEMEADGLGFLSQLDSLDGAASGGALAAAKRSGAEGDGAALAGQSRKAVRPAVREAPVVRPDGESDEEEEEEEEEEKEEEEGEEEGEEEEGESSEAEDGLEGLFDFEGGEGDEGDEEGEMEEESEMEEEEEEGEEEEEEASGEASGEEVDEAPAAGGLGKAGEGAGAPAARGSAVAPSSSGKARYVPPALRAADGGDAARGRQLRGLLNRLTENSLPSISAEVAKLLGEGRQRPMVDEMVTAVLGAALSEEHVLPQIALTSAALVRALSPAAPHLAAFLVEALVSRFEDDYAARRSNACANAVLLLSHLYNLGAVHCSLLYALVRRLIAAAHSQPPTAAAATASYGSAAAGDASDAGELELLLLLKLLTAVGPPLRPDGQSASARPMTRPRPAA